MIRRFEPSGPLRGTHIPPADKSISHRAAILAAIAEDPVHVRNYLDAEDTRSTLGAVQQLGALVEHRAGEIVIRGAGARSAAVPDGPIDVGNAGTLMRLLPGWLAGQRAGSWTFDGDAIAAWNDGAREDRRRLLEVGLAGGDVHELRVSVPNRPGVVAEVALALGRAGVNILDMALHPAEDRASGSIALWLAGDREALDAEREITALGLPVARA